MTRVATRMSADARETRKRFCGARSALLVKTATITNTLPTIVTEIITITTSIMSAVAASGYGSERGASVVLPSLEAFSSNTFKSIKSILAEICSFGSFLIYFLPLKTTEDGHAVLRHYRSVLRCAQRSCSEQTQRTIQKTPKLQTTPISRNSVFCVIVREHSSSTSTRSRT